MIQQPEIGSALRTARRSRGISVDRASSLAGISASTVKRWEAGKGLPSGRDLEAYFDLLGTPSDSPLRTVCGSQELRRPAEENIGRPLLRMLRAKRRRHMLTLEEISTATGLSVASLHRYETGAREPDPATLALLASAYGCSPHEVSLLCEGESGETGPDGSVIEHFVEPGRDPHFWVYNRLEAAARPGSGLSPEDAVDLVHGLMVMGDHRGVLEAWNVLKPAVQGLDLPVDRRAEIGLSLILARLTVSNNSTRAKERIAKWRDYAEELPDGPESARAMSHLARLAAAMGELEEAERWLNRLHDQSEKAGDAGMLFVCAVNRLLLTFDRSPSNSMLGPLDRIRANVKGPLQSYTGDVVALYMFDRLGDRSSVAALVDRCAENEAIYGFGSPLAAKIKRRHARSSP